MRHRHGGGPDRPDHFPDTQGGHHHPHEHRHRERHGRRLFDYGELRLLILAMIADKPSHGYELIKAIGERFAGVYSPSPGVIYPTLAWLDDMGYAAVEPESGGRKLFRITAEGEAFLVANRTAADALLARVGSDGEDGRRLPRRVLVAMKEFKHALRGRLERGALAEEEAERIAEALHQARTIVEQGE